MKQDQIKKSTQRLDKLLKEKGYTVKHTHLLDIVSNFTYNQSWFSIKKNSKKEEGNISSNKDILRYLEDLDQGKFKDKFFFGKVKKTDKWCLKDFQIEPNALFAGAMGTGKTQSTKLCLSTYLYSNSEDSIIFLSNHLKGLLEYESFLKIPQVIPILKENQILKTIDILYKEYKKRQEMFIFSGARNLKEHNEKVKEQHRLAKCVFIMEEFHAIPNHVLNYEKNVNKEGTYANKLKQLARVGRSYGIWFMGVSQRATSRDIPPQMVPWFSNKNIFKTSKGESTYLLGNTEAANISSEKKGFCQSYEGLLEYFMIDQKVEENLIKEYVKPLTFKMATGSFEKMIKEIESAEKNIEDSLYDLINSNNKISKNSITLLLKKMGHQVKELSEDEEIMTLGCTHVVDWKKDEKNFKVLVMIKDKLDEKHINRMGQLMSKEYSCNKGVIYAGNSILPKSFYSLANECDIEIIDKEDLLAMAKRIDLKKVK